jgi:hypothetical protein
MVEIWKKISWAVDYEVSNLGNIRSSKYGSARLLKPTMRKGYYMVCIRAENTIKQATLHRLVADAFVPNPYGYTIVNHKDENKTNNNANNLEWCTPQYNVTYKNAHKKSEEKHKKKVFKYSINGEYICSYNSMIEAEKETKVMSESISRSCRKINTIAGGYVWRWYKKENIATLECLNHKSAILLLCNIHEKVFLRIHGIYPPLKKKDIILYILQYLH